MLKGGSKGGQRLVPTVPNNDRPPEKITLALKTDLRRQWSWPDGAVIAVSVGLALEDFQFASQYVQFPRPGRVDPFSISYGDYGWRTGIWRLLELLDDFGIKANMSTNGLTAELRPQVVGAVAGEGHEINGHGWMNDVLSDPEDPDAERAEIQRCTRALEAATGERPVGWTGPGSAGTDGTCAILREEGYLWNGDDASDDIPFTRDTPAGKIVILPRTNIFHNDYAMWIAGRNPPGILWDGFRDTFDQLYSEGTRGRPGWTEITLHAHMAGRPTMIPTVRKCLRYAMDHGGVWFAPRREIAQWTLDRESNFAPGHQGDRI